MLENYRTVFYCGAVGFAACVQGDRRETLNEWRNRVSALLAELSAFLDEEKADTLPFPATIH